MIIYKITNLINDKVYVGQTMQKLSTRISRHLNGRGSRILKAAVEKYGKDNFKIEVIATASSIERLNALENQLIKACNSISPNGYNIRSGGGAGHTCNAELKTLISKSTKVAMACPILRKKLSDAKIGKSFTNAGSFKQGQQIRNTPIHCIETGEVFTNQLATAAKLGVSRAAISAHITGRNKTVKNLTFKLVKVV